MDDGRSTSRLSIYWVEIIPLTSSHDLNTIPIQTYLVFEKFRHKDFHDFPRLAFGCSSRWNAILFKTLSRAWHQRW